MAEKPLTIATGVYDDYHGAYMTLQSIRMFHQHRLAECEFLIVDNNPSKEKNTHGYETRKLAREAKAKYVPAAELAGVPQVRNEIFRQAETPYVLVLDCHVMLQPVALDWLLDYYYGHPNTRDLLMGPMLANGKGRNGNEFPYRATHQDLVWRAGALGIWAIDERGLDPYHEPFEIPQQGCGLFSCRRDAWPGLPAHLRGHGGNETFLMLGFQMRGDRVLCCPRLRWLHRFGRPGGPPFKIYVQQRINNYIEGFVRLGRIDDAVACYEHYSQPKMYPREAEIVARRWGIYDRVKRVPAAN